MPVGVGVDSAEIVEEDDREQPDESDDPENETFRM